MALPAGISTCTVTLGKALGSLFEDATLSGTVAVDRRLVWSATGDTIYPVASQVTASQSGGWLSFIVAHVDQAGFVDQSGNAIANFSYTFNGRATFSDGSVEPIVKHFQVFVGDTTKDLDLLPDGPATLPVVTPNTSVYSVAGLTGVVTQEQLEDLGLGGGGGGGTGVDLAEDLGPFAAGKGILLTSPDGTKVVRVSVGNDGELATEDLDGDGGGDPGGGAGTDPATVSGLATWFRPADIAALSDGGAVSVWPNAGPDGSTTDSGPGISNPPIYATNGINGHPAVRFLGDNSMRVLSTSLFGLKPVTAFAVVKISALGGNQMLLDRGAALSWGIDSTGHLFFNKATQVGIAASTTTLTPGEAAFVSVTYSSTGVCEFHINGTSAGGATNDTTFDTGPYEGGFGYGINGYVGEMVVVAAALDATARQGVEGYLAQAWGFGG